MKKETDLKLSDYFYLLLVFIGILLAIDWSFLTGSITGYEIVCDKSSDTCKTVGTSTYKPNVETQTVVYKSSFRGAEIYKDCAIYNRKNWSCKHQGGAEISFADGKYSYQSNPSIQKMFDEIGEYKQVGRLEYFYIWLKSFI